MRHARRDAPYLSDAASSAIAAVARAQLSRSSKAKNARALRSYSGSRAHPLPR